MRTNRHTTLSLWAAGFLLACLPAVSRAESASGSLVTAEFPEVLEFDFKKVKETYEKISANVGEVNPIIDKVLEKGLSAIDAGETAQSDPTEENRRTFVAGVIDFVRGAGLSKSKIAELSEDVRGVQSKIGILYTQAVTQAQARIEELKQEFARAEMKYKDLFAVNKKKRRSGDLSDWELRKLFEEEKRQVQGLNRLADRTAFQQDFLSALTKANGQSDQDFELYEQFFAEAADALSDITDLATSLPVIVERLQLSSALSGSLPSRDAAVAGFGKLEQTRTITKKIASQLMAISGAQLAAGQGESEEGTKVIMRQTEVYRRWVDGDGLEYRRPTIE